MKFLILPIMALTLFSSCSRTSVGSVAEYCQDLNSFVTQKNLVRMNLINAQVTRTKEGGPYKPLGVASCSQKGCEIGAINREPIKVNNPKHPDADKNGIVLYPNVNNLEEQLKMEKIEKAIAFLLENKPSKDFFYTKQAEGCFKQYPLLDSEFNFKKMAMRAEAK